jgi:hypothetical protein
MQVREIMRFRQTSAGVVPMEVLRSLALPMPDDVLEQFVFDHGTKDHVQRQYGHLDLHAIRWEQLALPAFEILACSVYTSFTDFVEAVADQTRIVHAKGWADVCLSPWAANHWQRHGTWMRSPVLMRGELAGSASALHLVEGHTRLGALRGLVESGELSPSSAHQVWVGEGFLPGEADALWREVLRTERMPFLDWLMGRVGDDGEIGIIAMRLIDVQFGSMSRVRVEGHDLDAVVTFARKDAKLGPMIDTITESHAVWERFVGG